MVVDARRAAVVVILLLTAVPSGWPQWPTWGSLNFGMTEKDLLLNVLLYVPLGLTWKAASLRKLLREAVLLSVAAETVQLFFSDRSAQPLDIAANVAGSAAGYLVVSTLGARLNRFRLARWHAAAAAAAAVVYLAVCPSICSDWMGPRVSERFLDRGLREGDLANAAVQGVFLPCHSGWQSTTIFITILLVVGLWGGSAVTWDPARLATAGCGLLAAALVVWVMQNPGVPGAAAAATGVFSALMLAATRAG